MLLRCLEGAECGRDGSWEEGRAEIGVLNRTAVKGVVDDIERLGEQLRLLTNGMGNGGGKFPRQRQVIRQTQGEFLW